MDALRRLLVGLGAIGLCAALQANARVLRVEASPPGALAAAVSALKPGDTLELQPGMYRSAIDLRTAVGLRGRGDVTIRAAAPGVVVKGSDVVRGWQRIGPARYEKAAWTHEPQQVFVDGVGLQQIGGQIFEGFPGNRSHPLHALHKSDGGIWPGRLTGDTRDLRPGSFHFDAERGRIVIQLQQDRAPESIVAEVSVRTYLFFSEGLDRIRVEGVRFEHANTTTISRSGAVTILGNQARIAELQVVHCDGVGISLIGNDGLVRGNLVQSCGQLGMNIRGNRHQVLDNLLVGNNTRGFNKWWEAGGAKFVGEGGLNQGRVQGNRALRNRGDGLWFDWGNRDNRVVQNLTALNEGFGLHYEASGPALISHNVSIGNGQRGLYALHSHGLLIERNLVALNTLEGIVVMDEMLRSAELDLEARDNVVRSNVVAYHGRALVLPKGLGTNRSDANVYLRADRTAPRFSLGWPVREWPLATDLKRWQDQSGQDRASLELAVAPPAGLVRAIEERRLDDEWRALLLAVRQKGRASGHDLEGHGPDLRLWDR